MKSVQVAATAMAVATVIVLTFVAGKATPALSAEAAAAAPKWRQRTVYIAA